VSPATVAGIVATSVLLPLAAGVGLRRLAPAFAEAIAKPLSIAATVLLIVAFVPVL
jgi:BASS family bile acid:Na+ symporter